MNSSRSARNELSDALIFAHAPQGCDFDLEDVSNALDIVCRNLKAKRGRVRLCDSLAELAGQSIVSPRMDNLSDELHQLSEGTTHESKIETIETVCDVARFCAVIRGRSN